MQAVFTSLDKYDDQWPSREAGEGCRFPLLEPDPFPLLARASFHREIPNKPQKVASRYA
jgi:hypothetical protein